MTEISETGWLDKSLEFVWEKVVVGESKFNPEKSCYQLAAEYRDSGKSPEESARNFINWQTGKAGLSGFALGLPGLTMMAVTIPADFASTAYLQLRMIAVIGILFGWDAKSDQLRTVAFSCLLGSVAGETVRDVGVKASTRFGARIVKDISGASLKKINKFLRVPNFLIKGVNSGAKAAAKTSANAGARAGTKGLINLTKMVPLLGGLVGGGINVVFTRQMGYLVVKALKDGPPDGRENHLLAEIQDLR